MALASSLGSWPKRPTRRCSERICFSFTPHRRTARSNERRVRSLRKSPRQCWLASGNTLDGSSSLRANIASPKFRLAHGLYGRFALASQQSMSFLPTAYLLAPALNERRPQGSSCLPLQCRSCNAVFPCEPTRVVSSQSSLAMQACSATPEQVSIRGHSLFA